MTTLDILLPEPLRGSGGHRTVISNAERFAAAGHRVRLHIQKRRRQRDPVAKTVEWFGVEHCAVMQGWPDALPDSDAVMATAWHTARAVATMDTPARRLYFVQDYEPVFHPAGDTSVEVAGTYALGLDTLVIGNWLRHKLWDDHRVSTASVPFTADLSIYRPGVESRRRQVAAIYQPDKPRRCPDLVARTLRLVLEAGVEVVTYGSSKSPSLGSGHRHAGLLETADLAALYQRSSAGLCLSASNPSRVPFEMMACGLPVVEALLPNTVFDLPDSACLLAPPTPESLARAVLRVVHSDPRKWHGAAYMAARPQPLEAQAFEAFVLADTVTFDALPEATYPRSTWKSDGR